jgi:hypothetical protein
LLAEDGRKLKKRNRVNAGDDTKLKDFATTRHQNGSTRASPVLRKVLLPKTVRDPVATHPRYWSPEKKKRARMESALSDGATV